MLSVLAKNILEKTDVTSSKCTYMLWNNTTNKIIQEMCQIDKGRKKKLNENK